MPNRIYATAVALAAVTTSLLTTSGPSALAADRRLPEGHDTHRCATYEETDHVYFGTRRHRVRRILDTPGHQVSAARFDALVGGLVDANHINHGPRGRVVISYPTCPEDGVPATFMVEYNPRTMRVIGLVWH